MRRDTEALEAGTFDLAIVGAGIYGAAAAREAALQGLSVALVDRDDLGARTSANSLKIMHGGLRYLQNLDFRRMRESIGERRTLGYLAPHLVRPMGFVIPCYGHLLRGREVMAVALAMNDLVSADRNRGLLPERRLPRGRVLSRAEIERRLPGLPEPGLLGGAIWYDGQATNTERLLFGFVRAAADAGAVVANHVEVEGFLEEQGRVVGVQARDLLTGDARTIRARITLNAAGPWVDRLLGRLDSATPARQFHNSKGMNLVTRRVFDVAAAIPYQEAYEDRQAVFDKGKLHFFIVPWKRWSLIGTRHLPWDGEPDEFRVTQPDVDRFLDEINRAYPPAALRREDVVRVYEGMLPALAGDGDGDGDDVQIGKQFRITDHASTDGVEGLVSMLGVKWTTARDVAERALAVVLRKLGRRSQVDSATVRLPGAEFESWDGLMGSLAQQADGAIPDDVLERLAESHGAGASALVDAVRRDPELGEVLDGALPTLAVELVWAARDELGVRLDDVVRRRTELASVGVPGRDVLRRAGEWVATVHGWSPERIEREVEATLERIDVDRTDAGPTRRTAG